MQSTVDNRVGGNVPATLVLARPVFLKVKIKFHFYIKQVINKSVSVIFGLVRLSILSYNRQEKHINRCKIIDKPPTHDAYNISVMQKVK